MVIETIPFDTIKILKWIDKMERYLIVYDNDSNIFMNFTETCSGFALSNSFDYALYIGCKI